MPGSVGVVGNYAFRDNHLTSVTIPSNVTTISNNAFIFNENLRLTIQKASGSITGSPWGAKSVEWTG